MPGAGFEPASPPVGQRLLRAPLLPISPPGQSDGSREALIGSSGGARGADRRESAEIEGRYAPLHAFRGTPVLYIRRLQGRGHRDRRRAPRADRGLRRRGVRQGDAAARRCRADRRPWCDQRDQRDRRRPGQQLARLRARRQGAGAALGVGLAAGDRSPALRLAAGQVGRDGQGSGRDRGPHRGGARPCAAAPGGPTFVDYPLDVVFTEAEPAIPSAAPVAPSRRRGWRRPRRCWRPRSAPRSWPAAVSTGAGGGGAAGACRGARHPGLPQWPGARVPAGRPRARLQPRPWRRARWCRRGAGDRGAA